MIKRFACDLISETVKEQVTEDLLDKLLSVLKLLRNLCASVASNQTNIGYADQMCHVTSHDFHMTERRSL